MGTREWTDYVVESTITPHLAKAFGLAARVQGLERHYALLLSEQGAVKLVKRLDGETVLAERDFVWEFGRPYDFRLEVQGNRIRAGVDGRILFKVEDRQRSLSNGGIALVCEEGRVGTDRVVVSGFDVS
jgi:hypothetical protein